MGHIVIVDQSGNRIEGRESYLAMQKSFLTASRMRYFQVLECLLGAVAELFIA